MKSKFLLAGFALVASTVAYAGCEDGQAIAENAAIKAASVQSRGCAADSENSDVVQNRDGSEVWTIAVRCRSFVGRTIYKVQLVEIEDAVCRVKKVTVSSNEE